MTSIIIIVFFIGAIFGKKLSDRIWRESFRRWTEEIYMQYVSYIEKLNEKIKALESENRELKGTPICDYCEQVIGDDQEDVGIECHLHSWCAEKIKDEESVVNEAKGQG